MQETRWIVCKVEKACHQWCGRLSQGEVVGKSLMLGYVFETEKCSIESELEVQSK